MEVFLKNPTLKLKFGILISKTVEFVSAMVKSVTEIPPWSIPPGESPPSRVRLGLVKLSGSNLIGANSPGGIDHGGIFLVPVKKDFQICFTINFMFI